MGTANTQLCPRFQGLGPAADFSYSILVNLNWWKLTVKKQQYRIAKKLSQDQLESLQMQLLLCIMLLESEIENIQNIYEFTDSYHKALRHEHVLSVILIPFIFKKPLLYLNGAILKIKTNIILFKENHSTTTFRS